MQIYIIDFNIAFRSYVYSGARHIALRNTEQVDCCWNYLFIHFICDDIVFFRFRFLVILPDEKSQHAINTVNNVMEVKAEAKLYRSVSLLKWNDHVWQKTNENIIQSRTYATTLTNVTILRWFIRR